MHIPLSGQTNNELNAHPVRLKFLSRFFERFRRQRRAILLENALDYRRSRRLKRALESLIEVDMSVDSVTEDPIGETWRPFRVEHHLGGTLAGTHGYSSFEGRMTVDVFDSSSMLFLQGEGEKTLRVLLPSIQVTCATLVEAFRAWVSTAGGENKWYSSSSSGTHVGTVLAQFLAKRRISASLRHTDVIDAIDASCQKAWEQRPAVKVYGRQLRGGIVLATALEVNGQRLVFMPTKFLQVLSGTVQRYIEKAEDLKISFAA